MVDSSAVVAVLLEEKGHKDVLQQLLASKCMMSAANRVESEIVMANKLKVDGVERLRQLIGRLRIQVCVVNKRQTTKAIEAWHQFGGRRTSELNFGDTFAYALAKHLKAPLLFIGQDFVQTDIESVLPLELAWRPLPNS